jgi:hypothetical protein
MLFVLYAANKLVDMFSTKHEYASPDKQASGEITGGEDELLQV